MLLYSCRIHDFPFTLGGKRQFGKKSGKVGDDEQFGLDANECPNVSGIGSS